MHTFCYFFPFQVWFQNRRAKFRRNERCSIRSSPAINHHEGNTSHVSSSNLSIDNNIRKHSSTILPSSSTTTMLMDKCNLHGQMDLTASTHYAMGFSGLDVVSLPNSRTNGYTYGTTTSYNAYPTTNPNRSSNSSSSCAYLPSTYCGPPPPSTPNYNNLSALRYKAHGYHPSI